MTYEKLFEIIRSSNPSDWRYADEQGVHTYRPDLNIRIQRRTEEGATGQSFNEPWAIHHPDPRARLGFFDIYYGSSLVDTFALVSVDGNRADLPLPDPKTKVVGRKDYELARAVYVLGTLDEYIQRSGLTVAEEQHAVAQ